MRMPTLNASTNPALLTVTTPALAPAAAIARLTETAGLLWVEGQSVRSGLYQGMLLLLASIAEKAAPLMKLAIADKATSADLVGVSNAQRVAKACESLLNELARRTRRRHRMNAMYWSQLARHIWADIALTQREYAPTAYLGIDWVEGQELTTIRIMPGAESALIMLSADPLVYGSSWPVADLSATLAKWVRT